MSKQIYEELSPYAWEKSECLIKKSDVIYLTDEESQCKHVLEYEFYSGGVTKIGNTWRLDPGVPYSWCSSIASFASEFKPDNKYPCFIDPKNSDRVVLDQGNIFSVLKLLFPLLMISLGVFLLKQKFSKSKFKITNNEVKKIALFISSSVFLAGIIGTFYLGVLPLYKLSRSKNWNVNECTVISSYLKSSSSSASSPQGNTQHTGYYIKIIYSYVVGDKTFVTDRYNFIEFGSGNSEKLSRVTDQYPIDAKVTCFVDPSNPYEAVLNRSFSSVYIFGFIPLILSFGGGILFVVARKFI